MRPASVGRVGWIVWLLAGLGACFSADAHSSHESSLTLDFMGDLVQVELQVPLRQIDAIEHRPVGVPLTADEKTRLATAIAAGLTAHSMNGQVFSMRDTAPIGIDHTQGSGNVVLRFSWRPPSGSDLQDFKIEANPYFNDKPTVILVSVRTDWMNGIFANDPQLMGALSAEVRSIEIDRRDSAALKGFASVYRLGLRHIAEGTDHLLFLLTLLLTAPVIAIHRRWAGFAGTRRSWLRIAKVVSAFTIGHSVSMAASTLGVARLPSAAVEGFIAVSIFISALHAMRPIFPDREAWVAAGFGLIHGMAFASTLAELRLSGGQLTAALFAFNAGIESMQLLVVALAMPALLLLSQTFLYAILRWTGATFAAIAAIGWIAERWFGVFNPVEPLVTSLAGEAGWIGIGITLVSYVAWFQQRRRRIAPVR